MFKLLSQAGDSTPEELANATQVHGDYMPITRGEKRSVEVVKVTDEMKGHAKIMSEEFALANLQLQMGRPRREVLHDLGVRTGVDDVRSLAAILIQADRFGSSIAQALRVQSDSMRTRRRQLAEEKAAKTAVQLIFPLVLFIFPGIFVVLVGPAAINIANNLLPKMK
jgi:tight adherence protein C